MKAIIYGVSGQDGAYLARLLLEKGYEVYGTSRDAQTSSFENLVRLGIRDQIKLISVAVNDFRSVLQSFIKIQPDEVYYLAGQSSVGLSFDQPVETMESVSVGTLNILEAIRFTGGNAKLYNAGSSECFGDTGHRAANEMTPFNPRSPYAVAKAAAYWEVATYREAYNLYACTGIAFNHESPLRPERFVTRKIVATACRIAAGIEDKLYLGNIQIVRDWGWAPEYVEAMWMMLQRENPEDFVIATGESRSLEDFINIVFGYLSLDWKQYIETDSTLLRPADLISGRADPTKAKEVLGWSARSKMDDIARLMVEADRRLMG
jgi:GDPmannose 4,6-dehydratase